METAKLSVYDDNKPKNLHTLIHYTLQNNFDSIKFESSLLVFTSLKDRLIFNGKPCKIPYLAIIWTYSSFSLIRHNI